MHGFNLKSNSLYFLLISRIVSLNSNEKNFPFTMLKNSKKDESSQSYSVGLVSSYRQINLYKIKILVYSLYINEIIKQKTAYKNRGIFNKTEIISVPKNMFSSSVNFLK